MSVTTINEIFAKPIDRSIEGVIKADDTSHLATEVEEYVLTNEAAKGVELVLEAYTNYTNANGVWISGFFGSGKSHLLKMLAHLLGDIDDHTYPRSQVCEQFHAKADDEFLPALIDKAERIKAKSLLFNIDQKATLISKDQKDALLKVFVKIFDESRGYYGNQGHIARFERDLDSRDQYAAFRDAFERIAGIPWTQGREQAALEAGNIDKAFTEVNGVESPGIIRQYSANYAVSIEDFADEVAAWLGGQPAGYRLNFFVDEVGQFIGTNTQLMLNLQTIAESLATKCQGRAWIFVTSQEDMEKVGGDRTKQQANDFSKIQARFKNRLKLTSQDVEEVIRKRLLAKTDQASHEVEGIYDAENANFKTLFDFVEGRHYPNYRDEAHFIGTYPFVTYQFPLFQAAIETISDHNIFEGRNSSVGERSMLGVVQQVASGLAGRPLGTLASFDRMFEGIRASLKSANQRAIINAENACGSGKISPLAVRLLKALFLVKYVDSFKATPRNLTVLVYDRFGTDLTRLGKDVLEALNTLEAQTYIQRNGDLYDYLTNEEQKIEQEIKDVDIDSSDVSAKLNKLLAESVVKTTKATAKSGQNFPFGYKLDGVPYGKQYELALHVISPESDFSLDTIRMQSTGYDELRVVLPVEANRILADLRLLLKTEKYVKRTQGSARTAIESRILSEKGTQNAEREKEIVERLRTAVGASTLIHNAGVLDVTATDVQTRINEGFGKVIAATYTNLSMLGGKAFGEQSLGGLVNPTDGMFESSATILEVPADDLLGHLVMRGKLHEMVTMKQLIARYIAKPYGWDLWSIAAVVAYLAGQSKIEIQLDGMALARTEIASALRNTQQHAKLVVAPQRVYDQKVVNLFRKFVIEFTDDGSVTKDAAELGRVGKEHLEAKLAELTALRAGAAAYPFIGQLDEPIRLLTELSGNPAPWFVEHFTGADDLLDAKDNTIDPIKAFLNGKQRTIYDDAHTFVQTNNTNIAHLPAGAADTIEAALEDAQIFRGTRTTQLGNAVTALQKQLDGVLIEERATATTKINDYWEQVPTSASYSAATETARQSVTRRAEQVLARVGQETQIPTIRSLAAQFADTTYPAILDELEASKALPTPKPKGADDGQTTRTVTTTPTKQSISIKKLSLPGAGGVLETEAEVDAYLDQLRAMLLATINDGKRITL
ncbi:BREX system P-loop protein BrxC [Gordonia pseudamarae]|uniref:BREX system P-loop protein BrxC n=1 Tax=Gordonia pseudamarae TaxID=2831662 RepID=A0ABX6ILB3_9ACTN|nr:MULTISPECIES: BREX system P-loop protein BrxC [Gordonia]MBD0020768.1 BREX system P-loop protein BrxC [Gordonia sp. (in: high G+C Gram-positive bacteria)]QHN27802.1 BREX system P-loop protein BrxC [Gordonia pseudamarae]QHN36684.1 BREX system P-loop protein BrxC [Gordonia pseudamarae]